MDNTMMKWNALNKIFFIQNLASIEKLLNNCHAH